ncbi:TlpA family protein disulfide reductase [Sphingobacterium sp. UBA5670]|uniref:TlpA family protein disulfide reductase n=1 Tax=Sphingobacterium sp. UBA5670 TaxID=1947502 RepID=UPI0025FCBFA4|nr:TlpA disulfide reductase family protein [Sphingobacterium sp. UBA5670]
MKKIKLLSNSSIPLDIQIIKITTFLILYTLVSMFSLSAQTPRKDSGADGLLIKPLKVGDTIPESLWILPTEVVNHATGKTTNSLQEYRTKKLIILDFWATWCTACIKGFPKIQALNAEFAKNIIILPVSDENKQLTDKFFQGVGQEYQSLTSVINDTVLNRLFPHRGIPYYVWIRDNKVIATTDGFEITAENIEKAISSTENQIESTKKIDRKIRPLLQSSLVDSTMNVQAYSIFINGYTRGMSAGSFARYTPLGKVYGRQFANLPLKDLYFGIATHLFKKKDLHFYSKLLSIECADPSLLDTDPTAALALSSPKTYSYELNVPFNKTDSLYEFMLADLNRYTNFVAIIEKRNLKCWVLKKYAESDKLKSGAGTSESSFKNGAILLHNVPLTYLLNHLNALKSFKEYFVDDSGIEYPIDIDLHDKSSIEALNNGLHQYGLMLVNEIRPVEVMVIRDKQMSIKQ